MTGTPQSRVRVSRKLPSDEIPVPLLTRGILAADRSHSVYVDRCRRWTNGLSFYVTVVLGVPIRPQSIDDDSFFTRVPDFRGDLTAGGDPGQQVRVKLSDGCGTELENGVEANNGRGLILIGSGGSNDRWEAHYWAEESALVGDRWHLEVAWPGQALRCSSDLSWSGGPV